MQSPMTLLLVATSPTDGRPSRQQAVAVARNMIYETCIDNTTNQPVLAVALSHSPGFATSCIYRTKK